MHTAGEQRARSTHGARPLLRRLRWVTIAVLVAAAVAIGAVIVIPQLIEATTARPVTAPQTVQIGDDTFTAAVTVPAKWHLTRASFWNGGATRFQSPDGGMTITVRTADKAPEQALADPSGTAAEPVQEKLTSGLTVWHFAEPDASHQQISVAGDASGPSFLIEVAFRADNPAAYRRELAQLLETVRVGP